MGTVCLCFTRSSGALQNKWRADHRSSEAGKPRLSEKSVSIFGFVRTD